MGIEWKYEMRKSRIVFQGKYLFFALAGALLFTATGPLEAATINAQSVSLADVRAAVTLAQNGDTIVVPAGTATWASTLTINKPITLQGAGIGQTIIIDGFTTDVNAMNFVYRCRKILSPDWI